METNETVTLSLERYDEMKAEIRMLREQVCEQTIVKEVHPPVYKLIILIISAAIGLYLLMSI